MITHKARHLITRNILKISSCSVRHHNFDGEAVSKTNLLMIAQDDKSHTYIQAYGRYGFKLVTGFTILGSCAVFPRALLHWNVSSADQITPESLTLFTLLEPKLDVLLIGKGDWNATVDSSIIKFLRSHKMNVEILPTEQACSTFNFLNSERRVVAAALIPPKVLTSPLDAAHDKLLLELSELEDAPTPEERHDREMDETRKKLEEQMGTASQPILPWYSEEEKKKIKESQNKKKPD